MTLSRKDLQSFVQATLQGLAKRNWCFLLFVRESGLHVNLESWGCPYTVTGCRSRMGLSLLLWLRESTRFGVEECEDAAPAADLVCLPWLLGTSHGFPEELRAGSTQRQSSPAAGRMTMCRVGTLCLEKN